MPEIKVKNSGITTLELISSASNGNLLIAETQKHIPFDIKRFYFIRDLDNATIRGEHAHKKHEQYIFCIHGSFHLHLDDGLQKQDIILDKSDMGIYIGAKLWHSMDQFSKDCIILVVSSDHYDENDYIRNYDDFLSLLSHENTL